VAGSAGGMHKALAGMGGNIVTKAVDGRGLAV
jgi:hypothetical protein